MAKSRSGPAYGLGPVFLFALIGISCVRGPSLFTREMSAVKAIQTIHTAQQEYWNLYGHFANSLLKLGPPATGTATKAAADLIDASLAGGRKAGYRFELKGSNAKYEVWAEPQKFGE